jgi:hypothetical protein
MRRRSSFVCISVLLALVLAFVALAAPRLCLAQGGPKPPTTAQQKAFLAAVAKAREELSATGELVGEAGEATTKISGLVAAEATDDVALANLAELATAVKSVAADDVPTSLTRAVAAVTLAKAALQRTHRPFEDLKYPVRYPSIPAKGLKQALEEYIQLVTDLEGQITEATDARSKLVKALQKIPSAPRSLITRLVASLGELRTMAELPPEDRLRATLAAELPKLTNAVRQRRGFGAKRDELANALSELKSPSISLPETAELTVPLNDRVKEVLRKLPQWMTSVAADVIDRNQAADLVLRRYRDDADRHRADAEAQVKQELQANADLDRIIQAGGPLIDQLQKTDLPAGILPPGFPITAVADSLRSIGQGSTRLGVLIAQLQQPYPVNIERWIAAQVPLYYFDDVPRLLSVLNVNASEKGGNAELRRQADEARRKLDETTQAVGNARQAVNDARTEVESRRIELAAALKTDRETLKRATAAANKSEGNVRDLTRQQRLAQTDRDLAKAQHDRDKTAADADPSNADKKAALKATEARLDAEDRRLGVANADLETAKSENDKAQSDKTAAQTQLDADENEETGLAGKLRTAEATGVAAEAAVRQASTSHFLAAQIENAAFGRTRENVPFWVAMPKDPIGSSTDPIQRVMLYGFDNRTVFIRGSESDVMRVQAMIAGFDEPHAQAELTLHTLEISSDTSKAGVKRATDAMSIVERQRTAGSNQVQAALSLLFNTIAARVAAALNEFDTSHPTFVSTLSREDREILAFYDPTVLTSLGWPPAEKLSDTRAFTESLRAVVPRPSSSATLAEALVVLALAKPGYRSSIFSSFQTENWKLQAMPQSSTAKLQSTPEAQKAESARTFPHLASILGEGDTTSAAIRSFQEQLVWELRYRIVPSILDRMEQFAEQDRFYSTKITEFEAQLAKMPKDTASWSELAGLRARYVAERLSLRDQFRQPLTLLWSFYDLPPTDVLVRLADTPIAELLAQARALRRPETLVIRHTRLAKLNELLKQMIYAVDKDLRAQIIVPMLSSIRDRLLQTKKIGVGVFQSTSILASNRLVARVDPRGSAQLTIGEETDVLQATVQLAQLYGAVQTGGLTGALGGLDQLPKEAPPAVYGITTGNVFQVTPIFDPTGQALRFQFDHVAATQIQEPNKTTNPQFPRIERHSINTEVQVTNHEIRSVSKFSSNAQLGLPKRRSGGIPVLKDIPFLKEVPLLGWFTLRKGRAAVAQQSVILVETTMFPTIQEVVDLLIRPIGSPSPVVVTGASSGAK